MAMKLRKERNKNNEGKEQQIQKKLFCKQEVSLIVQKIIISEALAHV